MRLSRRVFQGVALLVLAAAWGASAWWVVAGRGPYPWLAELAGGPLAAIVGWILNPPNATTSRG